MGAYGQIALGIVGGVIGAFVGMPWLGYAAGSLIGGALFPPELSPVTNEGPRLGDGRVQSSAYGEMLPICKGHPRIAGKLIWAKARLETKTDSTTEVGGKGGQPSQEVTQTTYTYSQCFAVALCDGAIVGIRKIWANGSLIFNVGTASTYETYIQSQAQANAIRVYTGSETQTADSLIAATETNAPAYRGVAYVMFDTLQLAQFGNNLPNLEFEVVTAGSNAATYVYLDVQDQLGFGADGSITPDGLILAFRYTAFTTGPTNGIISLLNPFTLQILRDYDPRPYMPGTFPSGHAPVMNAQGDIAFQDNFDQFWVWPAGGVPVKVGIDFPTRVVVDQSGTFFLAMRTTISPGQIAVIKVAPGTTAYQVIRVLPGTDTPMDCCDGGDGFIYVSRFGTSGTVEKISAGGAVAASWTVARNMSSIAVGGDGSVWYLTGSGTQQIYRIAPDFSSETLIFNESGTHTGAGEVRLARDWSNGDILYGDANIFTRYNEDGVLVRTIAGIRTFRVATNPNYPERIYGFNPVSASLGVNQFVAIAREFSLTPGAVTLAASVTDLCGRVGLAPSDLDVTTLTDEVRGYVVLNRGPVRGMLQPLMQAFQFDYVESGTVLKFVKRGGALAATILEDDLGAHLESQDAIDPVETVRTQEPEMPHEVAVRYMDQDADYQIGTQYARRLIGHSDNDVTISLPVVMIASEAKRVAEMMLYDAWASRSKRTIAVGPKYLLLEPTDAIDLALAEGTVSCRILNKTEQGTIELQTAGYDATIFSQTGTGAPAPAGQAAVGSPSPTNMVVLDTGLLREVDDTYGFYMVAAGFTSNWAGAKLFRSTDGGTIYADTGVAFISEAAIGFATAALANFTGGNVFDEVNTIDISLASGTLSSVTQLQVLNGSNAAYLGGEIIQFRTATLQSAGIWRLSGLLRGRAGTDWAITRHKQADVFALLESASLRNYDQQSTDQAPAVRIYKAVTFRSPVDLASPKTLLLASNRLKPFAPAQLVGARDGGNNVTFTWIRRARRANGWNDFTDVPLDEPTESYQTDVFAGTVQTITAITRASDGVFTTGVHGYAVADSLYIRAVGGMTALNERPYTITSVPTTSTFTVGEDTSGYPAFTSGGQVRKRGRTIASSTPTSAYSSALQTTDYGAAQNPIYAAVFQISSRVGRGYPVTGVI